MIKKLLGILVIAFGMCLAASSAHAQDMGKIQVFGGYSFTTNNIDNSIEAIQDDGEGYYTGTSTLLHGYSVAGVWNLSDHVGIEADFDGHNGTPLGYSCATATSGCDGYTLITEKLRQDLYTYTFGPKFTTNVGNFSIFAHALVGGAHAHEGVGWCYTDVTVSCPADDSLNTAGNGFALKTGGGVDWNHGHWGIRVLEVDYVHVSANATSMYTGEAANKFPVTANNIQLAAGVIFNLGK